MKVHFNNVDFSSSSGPNTFGARLASELQVNFGVNIVGPNSDYDIFLCFIEPNCNPRPGSKIIQRLDGIWFKPEEFKTHNRLIKLVYDNCHSVIWQSEFDKKMTEKWWGSQKGKVISNGIKLENAKISKELLEFRKKYNKIFVSSASWHRQKRLKENVELFLKNSSEKDCLIVLGNTPDYKISDSRIFYAGQKTHSECLQVYSIADWMIHLAWLDHCPNVVVEALSQDCPVICSSSGGTKEIVKQNGFIVPEVKKYNFELLDYDNPFEIEIPKLNLNNKINVDNKHLCINKTASLYFKEFIDILEEKCRIKK